MDGDAKMRYFKTLLQLGYKEIEVSYPSASQTEFDFTRRLITNPGLVPEDVTLQVMAPCREDLIRTTIDAARGAHKVIVHIHLSTSDCFRRLVFNTTGQQTIDLAVRCAKLIRELTKDSSDPEIRKTRWTLEFTPENFQDTSLDYALQICEAVKQAWSPTHDNQIIFNLAATVEVAMPNIFADQIEYFTEHITDREKVCVSLHNHNDRRCAVAATEMAQLAGADRVEGCLFGNGERTGNVDLVTLGVNLYTQGVSPGIDFSNMKGVVDVVEELTKIPVHFRAPYAGRYTFCTFTGTHQDAIRKGYRARAVQEKNTHCRKWIMPYLPMDPSNLGREHEAIIRLNSQSGKSGIGWYVGEVFGIEMPRELEISFTKVVKAYANDTGLELTHTMIENLFQAHYLLSEDFGLKILGCELATINTDNHTRVRLHSRIAVNGVGVDINSSGSDLLASTVDAACQIGLLTGHVYHKVAQVGADQDEFRSAAKATFVKLYTDAQAPSWGVSIHEDPTWSSLQAVLSAAARLSEPTSRGFDRLKEKGLSATSGAGRREIAV